MAETIGFIGLGAMGMPMALRLAAAGRQLLVHDRDAALVRAASGRDGIAAADGVGAVAAGCAVLLTCLPDPDAVAAVYEEVAGARRPGLLAGDCSTIGPSLARRLQRQLAAAGVRYVECPMLGGAGEAAGGQLFFVVSGAADDIPPLLPLLGALGRGHRVVGGPGDASRFKVVQNGLGLVQLAAIAEALGILARCGADLAAFCEVVAAGHGMADTPLFRAKAPLMLAAAPESQGRLRIGAKDIGLAVALAREVGVAAPLFERAGALFAAAMAQGLSEADIAAVRARSRPRAASRSAGGRLMQERTIEIATADGRMPTFVSYPEGTGRHPAVVLYMDALGIREELKGMARRIGTVGYYVLLPNLFYRDGGPSFDPALLATEGPDPEMMRLNLALSHAQVLADTRALLDFLGAQPAASRGAMAAVGWCMGGRHALAAAGTFPDRIKAMASLHGGHQVTQRPDSAHLLIPRIDAECYFAFAADDPLAPPEHQQVIAEALARHEIPHLLEVHPGTLHGFTFPERHCYHQAAAERVWERLFALFHRRLG